MYTNIYIESPFLRGLSKPKMLKEKEIKIYMADISIDIVSNMMTSAGL